MISARINPDLTAAATKAAERVNLKMSDLVRVGLQRVVEEITRTGQLKLIGNTPAAARKAKAKN